MASEEQTTATPIAAADFDGTLCAYAFPACGEPVAWMVALLRRLKAEGWRIVIHSARVLGSLEPGDNGGWSMTADRDWYWARGRIRDMLAWLRNRQAPFDAIWGLTLASDPYEFGINGAAIGKLIAHVYLDDRSPGFEAFAALSEDEQVAWCWAMYRRAEGEHAEGAELAAKEKEQAP